MRIFCEETTRSACCTPLRSSSERLSAIFLRLPGLAPDRRGSKEGDHPTIYIYIYIYIASDRFEIRSITVGLAGARPNQQDKGSRVCRTRVALAVWMAFFRLLTDLPAVNSQVLISVRNWAAEEHISLLAWSTVTFVDRLREETVEAVGQYGRGRSVLLVYMYQ